MSAKFRGRGRRFERKRIPLNEDIRFKTLQVVDHEGTNHGEITTEEALQIAKSAGLDLFVVSDKSSPPIAKILDYGKHKFQAEKKAKLAKKNQAGQDLKEIKMRYKIDIGDYNTRLKQGSKFLEKGNKLKLNIFLRGREIQHKHLAEDLANRFLDDVAEIGHSEAPVKMIGRSLIIYVTPGPDKNRLKKLQELKEQENAENNTQLQDTPSNSNGSES